MPIGQARQLPNELPPGVGLYVPGMHGMHCEAPAEAIYWPAGHGEHVEAPFNAKVPG